MRRLRFLLISIVSFISVSVSSIFIPGSFLNRTTSLIFCTTFSVSSTFCTVNSWSLSERVMAMNSSTIEINSNPLNNTTYLAQQQNPSSPILLKQGTLQPGDSLLPDKRLFDSYDFSGRAGQSVIITLESQNFNPYLQLLDSQRKQIADSGKKIRNIKNINSVIKITLPRNDTYHVIVTSHETKGKGRYTLTVSDTKNPGAISSSTPEGCKIVLNTKNVDGKPFPDSVELIAKDKNTCRNSFKSRINPNGNGAIVVEDTDEGSVIHQFDDLPGRGVEITTKYPDGATEIFTIKPLDPNTPGTYQISITGRDGKTQTGTTTVPKNIQENPPSNDVVNGGQSETSYCQIARRFCQVIKQMSSDITNAEIAIIFSVIWNPLAPLMLARLAVVDFGFTVYQYACFAIVGGDNTPSLPFGKLIEKLATKFDELIFDEGVKKIYDEIEDKAAEEAQFGEQLDKIREGTLAEAVCKKLVEGRSTGDPHLVTFDGLRYDLQSIGEVILTKSKDGNFEVQTRHAPFSSSLTVNSAVAVKVGSDRVTFYAREFPDGDTSTPLRVNGKPVTIQGDKLTLKGGGEILKQESNYVINSPRGEKVLVSPSSFGNNAFFNISPFVYNQSGKYSGLLGNVNGNPNDDLQIRGGGNISEIRSTYGDLNKVFNQVGLRLPGVLDKGEKIYFDRLYKEFGDSWRVKQKESLFDYPPGKTTENYSDRSFPNKYLTLNMLSPDQIQKARNACTEAKVTQDLMEGCIFDVGFSGFSEFARTTAEINGYIDIVNQLLPGLKIPSPGKLPDVIEKLPKRCLPFVGCL